MIDQAKDESEKEPMHEALDELMSVEIEELNHHCSEQLMNAKCRWPVKTIAPMTVC